MNRAFFWALHHLRQPRLAVFSKSSLCQNKARPRHGACLRRACCCGVWCFLAVMSVSAAWLTRDGIWRYGSQNYRQKYRQIDGISLRYVGLCRETKGPPCQETCGLSDGAECSRRDIGAPDMRHTIKHSCGFGGVLGRIMGRPVVVPSRYLPLRPSFANGRR